MNATYAVVDSGTTSTRLRLWRDGQVVWSGRRAAGARDTAIEGHHGRIRDALRALLSAARSETDVQPKAVICSGMITSNLGLHEVPHLPAPASPRELARGIVEVAFEDVSALPIAFVPGVKTHPQDLALDRLDGGDVLRGEEAEVVGLRDVLGLASEATFLHFGSHHKAVETDAEGRITASRTAITGELLAAMREHTILKSSTAPLEELELDTQAARAGAEATERHGLGRAGFLVRIGEQLGGVGRARMTSYLIGALAALDLPLLEGGPPSAPIVLYGHGAFPDVLERLLEGGSRPVHRVDGETADLAAATGAVTLYTLRQEDRA
jgi:2-dehydro-3-deoxygalactonokinase